MTDGDVMRRGDFSNGWKKSFQSLEKRAWCTAVDAAVLLALAAALAAGVNAWKLRGGGSGGLPWVGDWDSYVESKALAAGIGIVTMRELVDRVPSAVLDARPRELYRAGHVPGAWPCPAGDVDASLAEHVADLDPAAPVAVYCDGAACADSLEVALELKARGFARVGLYPGGWSEWTANGGAVETEETEAAP